MIVPLTESLIGESRQEMVILKMNFDNFQGVNAT